MKKILLLMLITITIIFTFKYVKVQQEYNIQNTLINKNNYYLKIDTKKEYKGIKELEQQRLQIEYCNNYYSLLKQFEQYILINNDNKDLIKLLNEKEKKGLLKKEEKERLINITELILNTKKIGFSVYFYNVCINKTKFNTNLI